MRGERNLCVQAGIKKDSWMMASSVSTSSSSSSSANNPRQATFHTCEWETSLLVVSRFCLQKQNYQRRLWPDDTALGYSLVTVDWFPMNLIRMRILMDRIGLLGSHVTGGNAVMLWRHCLLHKPKLTGGYRNPLVTPQANLWICGIYVATFMNIEKWFTVTSYLNFWKSSNGLRWVSLESWIKL